MAQKAVEYQDTPKGDQQCSNCSLFQEPNACTLVDGEISPAGWCKFWVKKTGWVSAISYEAARYPRGYRVAGTRLYWGHVSAVYFET
jgi:hypothetical protein